jgi:hypothetical protein
MLPNPCIDLRVSALKGMPVKPISGVNLSARLKPSPATNHRIACRSYVSLRLLSTKTTLRGSAIILGVAKNRVQSLAIPFCSRQIHLPLTHLPAQIVFDFVSSLKYRSSNTTPLAPHCGQIERVSAAKIKGYDMVQFTGLGKVHVIPRTLGVIPLVSTLLLILGTGIVANTSRLKCSILQHSISQHRTDRARPTSGSGKSSLPEVIVV